MDYFNTERSSESLCCIFTLPQLLYSLGREPCIIRSEELAIECRED